MDATRRIRVSCVELDEYFFRDGNGKLTPLYSDAIIDLTDFPPSYFPNTDFPCRELSEEQEDRVYDLIIESELYLPLEERYSRWNAYKAVLGYLWNACSSTTEQINTSAREVRIQINKKIRLLPNPKLDAPQLLRKEFDHYKSLFEQNSASEKAWEHTRYKIAEDIVKQVWDESNGENDLPFGEYWTIDQLKSRPYDYWTEDLIWTWEGFWDAIGNRVDVYIEALSQLTLLRWLQRMIGWYEASSTEAITTGVFDQPETNCSVKTEGIIPTPALDKAQKKVSQPQRALYYFYLHETESIPRFSKHPLGIEAAMAEVAQKDGVSAKNFQMQYNKLTKYSNRVRQSMVETIRLVLPMLTDFPLAKARAETELKVALTR